MQAEAMKKYNKDQADYDKKKGDWKAQEDLKTERRELRERQRELNKAEKKMREERMRILERQQDLAAKLGHKPEIGEDVATGQPLRNGVPSEISGEPKVEISSRVSSDGDSNEAKGAESYDAGKDEDDEPVPFRDEPPEKPDLTKGLSIDEYFKFTKEDLVGHRPSTALESLALEQLKGLIGLKAVKKAVENMVGMLETNYERELAELAPLSLTLNQVFYGAPGTGKTTVAKLYGQILASLTLLSDGEVVVKNPSDFIRNAVGMSESNTRNILAATVGKVLVVNEAYMLASGSHGQGGGSSYGASVIDTSWPRSRACPARTGASSWSGTRTGSRTCSSTPTRASRAASASTGASGSMISPHRS